MLIRFNRILWLQPCAESGPYDPSVKGLRMLGATVMPINYREKVLELGIGGARKALLKIIDDFTPDLILASFFSDTYELSPEFLREVSAKAPLVINAGDDEVYGTWQTIYFAQSADAVMTSDFGGRFMYEQLSIPTIYFRAPILDFLESLPSAERVIDVSFVGDCNKVDRSSYIEYLRENGIKVVTYGNGSENGFVSRMGFLEIICKSKISLNFSGRSVLSEILNREPWRVYFKHLSTRAYEAARVKTFCLSEYCLGLDEMLTIGREVDVFHSKEELLEKVNYYLEHDTEREKMASNAFDKVNRDFYGLEHLSRSYNLLHDRLQSSKGLGKKRPLFRSYDFNASEVKGNFFIFIKLLMTGKLFLAIQTIPYFFKFNLSSLVGIWKGGYELAARVLCR